MSDVWCTGEQAVSCGLLTCDRFSHKEITFMLKNIEKYKHKVRKNEDIITQEKVPENHNFGPFEAQNDLFLTTFGQNQANFGITKKYSSIQPN